MISNSNTSGRARLIGIMLLVTTFLAGGFSGAALERRASAAPAAPRPEAKAQPAERQVTCRCPTSIAPVEVLAAGRAGRRGTSPRPTSDGASADSALLELAVVAMTRRSGRCCSGLDELDGHR